MEVETYFKKVTEATNGKEKYDAEAKQLLADKQILARILRESVSEFKNIDLDTIMRCIEGEPSVGEIPVDPGLSEHITGISGESVIHDEGRIVYDVIFKAITPADLSHIGIIVNLEMQNSFHPGYSIPTRGIYYCARMLSAQSGTEFIDENYDDLKKVYSIWICAAPPNYCKNTIVEFKLEKNELFGDFPDDKVPRYDLLSVIMVCVGEEANESNETLCGMLYTLFVEKLSVRDKQEKLKSRYGFKLTKQIKERMSKMCNLSDGIYADATLNRDKEKIAEMLKQGKTPDAIHDFCGYPMELILDVQEELLVEA